jgi:hypothetical protein
MKIDSPELWPSDFAGTPPTVLKARTGSLRTAWSAVRDGRTMRTAQQRSSLFRRKETGPVGSLPRHLFAATRQASETSRKVSPAKPQICSNINNLIRGGARWIRTRDISRRTANTQSELPFG